MSEHRPEPPFKDEQRVEAMKKASTIAPGDFKAGELTPWQDLSRGLKTLEGSVASLEAQYLQMLEVLNGHTQALPALQHGAFLKQEHLEEDIKNLEGSVEFLQSLGLKDRLRELKGLQDVQREMNDAFGNHWYRILALVERDQQLTATIEGVDAHLEEVEAQEDGTALWLKDVAERLETVKQQVVELHSTFQASIDRLDAKFDEYMGYVRATSHTTVGHATRITQLEQVIGQQRTMIETALRALKDRDNEELSHYVSDLPEVSE